MLSVGTPRNDVNRNAVWPIPTAARPRPSVCARSAKIGPEESDVFTGMPPSNRKVTPPDVVAIGTLPMLVEIALVMNPMRLPFSATADGTK